MKDSKPSIALAYDVQRQARKRKKMAKGGKVSESAATEHRPMPEQTDDDAAMVARNQGKKPLMDSGWIDDVTVKQAQKPSITPLSRPKMAESSVLRTKLRDQEEDQMGTMQPNNGPQRQPAEIYNEKGAKRQGPDHPQLHAKMMAQGGEVIDKNEERIEGMESRPDKGWGAIIVKEKAEGGMIDSDDQPHPEADIMQEDSIAAAIMARRKMMALGGEVEEDDSQVDIDDNNNEMPNQYYGLNEAALKENYDEDLEGMSQPIDSNRHSVKIDSDAHDMVSQIRAKMKAQRQFKVR